jgi:hypothetical protein
MKKNWRNVHFLTTLELAVPADRVISAKSIRISDRRSTWFYQNMRIEN